MRVLLVAPSQASLPQSTQEVEAVVNSGLVVRLLQASVEQRDLVSELSTPNRYDILWLATHGNQNGVQLSSEILSLSAMVSLVRGSGVKLVFLNTCSSLAMAIAIQNEANVDVICTITDVPDIDAYRTGALFAAKLAQTNAFRKSYEQSKPGHNSTYVYLSKVDTVQNGDSEFGKLRKTVDELQDAARLRDKVAVHGKAVEIVELVERINTHDGEITGIKGEITGIKGRLTVVEIKQSPSPSVLIWRWLAVFTAFVALVAVIVKDVNDFLFYNIWSEIIGVSVLILLALMFWLFGDSVQKKQTDDYDE